MKKISMLLITIISVVALAGCLEPEVKDINCKLEPSHEECVDVNQPVSCGDGFILVGEYCEVVLTQDDCGVNEVLTENDCLYAPPICEVNEEIVDGECVNTTGCTVDEELILGMCVTIQFTCETGYADVDGECVDITTLCELDEVYFSGTCQPISSGKTIFKDKNLTVRNLTTDYTFDTETLQSYSSAATSSILYVEIEEFILMLGDSILPTSFEYSDVLILRRTFDVPSSYGDSYDTEQITLVMTINAKDQTITVNDLNFLEIYSDVTTAGIFDNVLTESIEIVEQGSEVTFDFDKYDFDIVEEDGKYYIPTFLASLLLVGEYYDVFFENTNIFLIDESLDLYEVFEDEFVELPQYTLALGKHTENYLALYFDYFYGLKGERNVSSFIEYLDDYNFSILTPDFKIVDSIFKFISSLDDLHSDVIYYGTDIPDLDLLFSGEYGEREEKIIDAYIQYECYQYEEAITFEEYEEYYLMNLIYFTEETSAVIKESLQGLDPNKDLIIDVSCNTGGFLLGVIELVSFLTDENIELSIRNSLSNELVTQTFYTQENTAVSNDIFVITSNVSYSGANLFASLVKDMNLGLIIGEDSSGGGFIVDTTVLPNGTYIMSSGVLNMLNDDYESIESGIEVDVDYIRTDNWYSNYKFIGHLFENLVDYDVTHTDDNGSIQVSYTLHDNNEYEINKIIVEVIDLDTGSSILDESNFGTSFTVGGSFINTSSYSITVSVTFTINDIEVVEIIYDEVVNK